MDLSISFFFFLQGKSVWDRDDVIGFDGTDWNLLIYSTVSVDSESDDVEDVSTTTSSSSSSMGMFGRVLGMG